MKSPSKRGVGLAAFTTASSYHCDQGFDAIGFICRLVGSDSADARETHRQPRLVARAAMNRIERDFEDQALLDFADWAKALNRVTANPPVEPFQFLVGEAEIGLAHRQKFPRLGPAPERVIAVKAGALAGATLGVHQHAIGGQGIALPFVP